jgi:hypothetical protein
MHRLAVVQRFSCRDVKTAERDPEMSLYRTFSVVIIGLSMTGCTSDPDAPVNQTFPIRQMDHFFGSEAAPPRLSAAPGPDYTHQPGYAPAYPPY